jgi:hypothetical protein
MAVILRTTGNVVYSDYGRQFPIPLKTSESREVEKIFCGLPPGIEPFLWMAGKEYFWKSCYPAGSEAEAVFSLGHYLFYGDPSRNIDALGFGYEAEREWVVEEILSLEGENKFSSSRDWSQRAARCIPAVLESTETATIRASIVALKAFLGIAPTRKDATHLKEIISQIENELLIRTLGPLSEIF